MVPPRELHGSDKNFTAAKMQRRLDQIDASIKRYLAHLDTADRQEPAVAEPKQARLQGKIARLKQEIKRLYGLEAQRQQAPDQQIALTDPDARSMATSGRGTGMVGYNVQTAVEAEHHLSVAYEVTNVGHDHDRLTNMAEQARSAPMTTDLTVVVDRGHFDSAVVGAGEQAGITTYLPTPLHSTSKADGRFGKPDFLARSDDLPATRALQRLSAAWTLSRHSRAGVSFLYQASSRWAPHLTRSCHFQPAVGSLYPSRKSGVPLRCPTRGRLHSPVPCPRPA